MLPPNRQPYCDSEPDEDERNSTLVAGESPLVKSKKQPAATDSASSDSGYYSRSATSSSSKSSVEKSLRSSQLESSRSQLPSSFATSKRHQTQAPDKPPRPSSRSQPRARPPACSNPNCQDPKCSTNASSKPITPTTLHRIDRPDASVSSTRSPVGMTPTYAHLPPPPNCNTPPPPAAIPRRRTQSSIRPRPQSITVPPGQWAPVPPYTISPPTSATSHRQRPASSYDHSMSLVYHHPPTRAPGTIDPGGAWIHTENPYTVMSQAPSPSAIPTLSNSEPLLYPYEAQHKDMPPPPVPVSSQQYPPRSDSRRATSDFHGRRAPLDYGYEKDYFYDPLRTIRPQRVTSRPAVPLQDERTAATYYCNENSTYPGTTLMIERSNSRAKVRREIQRDVMWSPFPKQDPKQREERQGKARATDVARVASRREQPKTAKGAGTETPALENTPVLESAYLNNIEDDLEKIRGGSLYSHQHSAKHDNELQAPSTPQPLAPSMEIGHGNMVGEIHLEMNPRVNLVPVADPHPIRPPTPEQLMPTPKTRAGPDSCAQEKEGKQRIEREVGTVQADNDPQQPAEIERIPKEESVAELSSQKRHGQSTYTNQANVHGSTSPTVTPLHDEEKKTGKERNDLNRHHEEAHDVRRASVSLKNDILPAQTAPESVRKAETGTHKQSRRSLEVAAVATPVVNPGKVMSTSKLDLDNRNANAASCKAEMASLPSSTRVKALIRNVSDDLTRKPPKQGKQRIVFHCICGRRIAGDYKEQRPGGFDELRNLFTRIEQRQRPQSHLDNNNPSTGGIQSLFLALFLGLKNGFNDSGTKGRTTHDVERQSRGNELNNRSGQQATQLDSQAYDPRHLLLLLPHMKTSKVQQPTCTDIQSDRQFFETLRCQYRSRRLKLMRKWSLTTTTLQEMHFVKFSLLRKDFARVLETGVVPPGDMKNVTYAYEDAPVSPPIASEHLVHFTEHPCEAEVEDYMLKWVPKKLRGELTCPREGYCDGYGIQCTEGLDPGRSAVLIFLSALISIAFAVVWSAVRDDISGGFTAGGTVFLVVTSGVASLETVFG